jgi:hypothetical protein
MEKQNDQHKNIFGCYMQVGFDPNLKEEDFSHLDKISSPYIWGDEGISNKLKKLEYKNYGNDLELVLFKFHIKPTSVELGKREIGNYSKKEKSIAIPVVIDDNNFFSKSETQRVSFLKEIVLRKMDLLEDVIKKKSLDTNFELLKSDTEKVLN